jgi:hypothetical protein
MKSNPNPETSTREQIIRLLEQFPVEALQAALSVLAARNQKRSQ